MKKNVGVTSKLQQSVPTVVAMLIITGLAFFGGFSYYRAQNAGASDVVNSCPQNQFPTDQGCSDLSNLTDAGQSQYLTSMLSAYSVTNSSDRATAVKNAGSSAAALYSKKCDKGTSVGGVCVSMLPPPYNQDYQDCVANGGDPAACAQYVKCLSIGGTDSSCGGYPGFNTEKGASPIDATPIYASN